MRLIFYPFQFPNIFSKNKTVIYAANYYKNAGLEKNNTDRKKCQEYFDIYKECKEKEVQICELLCIKI